MRSVIVTAFGDLGMSFPPRVNLWMFVIHRSSLKKKHLAGLQESNQPYPSKGINFVSCVLQPEKTKESGVGVLF